MALHLSEHSQGIHGEKGRDMHTRKLLSFVACERCEGAVGIGDEALEIVDEYGDGGVLEQVPIPVLRGTHLLVEAGVLYGKAHLVAQCGEKLRLVTGEAPLLTR